MAKGRPLDIAILHGPCRRKVMSLHAKLPAPCQHGVAGQLGSVDFVDRAALATLGDLRGTIVMVGRRDGNDTAVNAYDEYGVTDSGNTGRFGYTGQAWVPELGMFYYKARMYSPTLGRFMQTDPIGYADGMNIYAYVGNDPKNGVDPTGLEGDITVTGKRECTGPFFGVKIDPHDIAFVSNDYLDGMDWVDFDLNDMIVVKAGRLRAQQAPTE